MEAGLVEFDGHVRFRHPLTRSATYLDAVAAAMFAGLLASPGGSTMDVARAAAAAPRPPGRPRPPDLLLDGLAALYNQGYTAAVPLLRQALAAADSGTPSDEEPHWLWLACVVASHVWDDERWELLSRRYIQLVRKMGALAELPLALDRRARPLLFAGELAAAAALLDETRTVEAATGNPPWPYGELSLAAFRGNEADATALISSIMADATQRGEGYGITAAEWANSVLGNGLGRPRDAMAAAERATAYHGDMGFSKWALVELVEAAVHSGMTETAAGAYRRLTAMTGPASTDWALGLAARSRAQLSDGDEAEGSYREAIDRLGRTRLRVELARAHLLYGEWLRRDNRRADARTQLRTAHEMLDAMGLAQDLHQARHRFPPRAAHRAGQTRAGPAGGLGRALDVVMPGYGCCRPVTCTSYTLSGRAAGPLTTPPVVTSNSEPWHWHMIVVPVSSPPDRGHAWPAQVQRSSNA